MKARALMSVTDMLLRIVLLGTVLFAAPGLLLAQAAARPNFVVIMTDDQNTETMKVMTKTRNLIGSGTTFSSSFVGYPLCCPSRATFLTGQYPHNHGVLSNNPPTGGYAKLNHTNTLPVWLQAAGYFTSHIGKYLNGYGPETTTSFPPGWNHWQGLAGNPYQMYRYTINDNGIPTKYGSSPADYQTDVIATRAEVTIDEALAIGRPFFLSIAPAAIHHQAQVTQGVSPEPAPRHIGAFSNATLPKPPSYNEANVADKPADIRGLNSLTAGAVAQITARYRAELASLLSVDDLVKRVIDKLTSAGVLNNTVVIFTSDNGLFHGEHRIKNGKLRVYEEAVRVPLLIRGGGFPANTTINRLVSNVDLAPTIVSLAGATASRVMDGRSLLTLALDPNVDAERDILIETSARDAVPYQAVRNSSFLYVEHGNGERELYDMRVGTANYDPYQLNSRHANSAYAQIRSELATKLNQLRTCSGTTCAVQ